MVQTATAPPNDGQQQTDTEGLDLLSRATETREAADQVAENSAADNDLGAKIWNDEELNNDARAKSDAKLDAKIKAMEQSLLTSPTSLGSSQSSSSNLSPVSTQSSPEISSQNLSPVSSESSSQTSSSTPSSSIKKRVKPFKRKDLSPPTSAGPSHSAPQPFSENASEEKENPLWAEESPPWAKTYEPEKLGELGIKVGDWEKHIRVNKPEGKMECPPLRVIHKGKIKAPSWAWVHYVILSKIPGGMATCKVLSKMAKEWCPVLKDTDKNGHGTARVALTRNPCFFLVGGEKGPNNNLPWRLSNLGETRVKRPGPQRGKAPNRKSKGDQSKETSPESKSESTNSPNMATSPTKSGSQWTPINRPLSGDDSRRLAENHTKRKREDGGDNTEQDPEAKRSRSEEIQMYLEPRP
jgi:hypothetical protein